MFYRKNRVANIINSKLLRKYYPDKSKNGTVIFYNWLRTYIQLPFKVLNIGAGSSSDNIIKSLKGEVQKVVGVDIDHEIMDNDDLDDVYIIKNDTLPFDDNTFDLAWSDYVFEHIEKPDIFLKEIYRVLKPKASFFFRTPNKYHYVSIFSQLSPHWMHNLISNRVRGLPNDVHEPYPTYYRLNSKKDISTNSKLLGFRELEMRFIEAEPSYLVFHPVPFLMGVLYERMVNRFEILSRIRANIFGRLEK